MINSPETSNNLQSSLTLKDGLELALQAGKNVDSHWSQFYAFLFALVGWLASNISIIGYREAIIISIASTAYFTLNMIATIRAYIILNLIIDETVKISEYSVVLSKSATAFIESRGRSMKLPFRIPIAILAHSAASATVVYLAWKAIQ